MRELIYISCNLLQQYPQSHCGLDMMSETLILPTSHFTFSLYTIPLTSKLLTAISTDLGTKPWLPKLLT